MHIAIITDSIEWGPVSVGNYTMNLVENLVEIAKEDMEFVLIHRQKDNNPIYKKTEELIFPSPIERVSHSFFPLKVLSFARRQFSEFFYNYKLQLKILNAGIDVVHIPHLAGATAPPIGFYNKKVKLIVTLHGVAPLVVPPELYYNGRALLPRTLTYIQVLKCIHIRHQFYLNFLLLYCYTNIDVCLNKHQY